MGIRTLLILTLVATATGLAQKPDKPTWKIEVLCLSVKLKYGKPQNFTEHRHSRRPSKEGWLTVQIHEISTLEPGKAWVSPHTTVSCTFEGKLEEGDIVPSLLSVTVRQRRGLVLFTQGKQLVEVPLDRPWLRLPLWEETYRPFLRDECRRYYLHIRAVPATRRQRRAMGENPWGRAIDSDDPRGFVDRLWVHYQERPEDHASILADVLRFVPLNRFLSDSDRIKATLDDIAQTLERGGASVADRERLHQARLVEGLPEAAGSVADWTTLPAGFGQDHYALLRWLAANPRTAERVRAYAVMQTIAATAVPAYRDAWIDALKSKKVAVPEELRVSTLASLEREKRSREPTVLAILAIVPLILCAVLMIGLRFLARRAVA